MSDTLTVFLWSLPEEISFRDYLRSSADRVRVCPLAPAAWYTARQLFRKDEILDCRALVSAEERQRLDIRASESAERLRGLLLKRKREPWLSGFEFVHTVTPVFFYLEYWQTILSRLRKRGYRNFRTYGLFARSSVSRTTSLEADILDLLLLGAASRRFRIVRRLASLIGIGNFHLSKLVRFSPYVKRGWSRARRGESLLVAGLQETDSVFEGPLVSRLRSELGNAVRWWRIEEGRTRLSPHEKLEVDKIDHLLFRAGDAQWRYPWVSRLVRLYLVARLSRAMRYASDERISLPMAEEIAHLIVSLHPDPVLRYFHISACLDALRPLLVVGMSNLAEMAYVRAWCRHRCIPYFRLPHGVEAAPRMPGIHDADYVGVMGQADYSRLLAQWQNLRCFKVGGLHLGMQGKKIADSCKGHTQRNRRTVCYLQSASLYSNYPDTFTELMGDLAELSAVSRDVGAKLVVRLHPRADGRETYEEIKKWHLRSICLAQPAHPLALDLKHAIAAVTRIWSGACVLSLYCGIPVVGWLPRPGIPESDEKISRLPLCARTPKEMHELLFKLVHDGKFVDEVLHRQRSILEEEIENPHGDPYDLACQYIVEAFKRLSELGNLRKGRRT